MRRRDVPASAQVPAKEDVVRRRLISHKAAVSIAYVASIFMSAMDNQIVNVMLPTLGRDFHASLASAQWAVVGYMVSLAVFIPASGWLGDRFGTKRTFIAALLLFTLGSAACGAAPSLLTLVVFRIVQGSGGGLLTPVATTMLFRAFPPSERARMTRMLIVPILLGPVLAQPIGGLLVQHASWRWAFYLNVPIGLAALATSARYLLEWRDGADRRLDLPGLVLSAVALALFTLTFTEAALHGWSSTVVLVTGLVALCAVALCTGHLRRVADPVLKVALYRDRIFRATNVVGVLNTTAFFGLLFLAPVFLQEAKGETAMTAGLTTFATAIGAITGAQIFGRLYHRVGPRRMAATGSLSLAAALVAFLAITGDTSLWWVRLVLFCAGLSQGTVLVALQTSMFASISAADMSSGSALFNAARQASSAVGIAVFTTVVASVGGGRITAFHAAFVAAAIIAVCAGAAAVLIHDEDAATTRERAQSSVAVAAAD